MCMLKYIVVSVMAYMKQRTCSVKAIYLGVMKWDENQHIVVIHSIKFQSGVPEQENQWTFFEEKKNNNNNNCKTDSERMQKKRRNIK